MSATIRATTTVEGSAVTLNVAAMTVAPPPPPPPPFRVALSRRGATVTIKRGGIDITIDIPADAKKPAKVHARGRVICEGPAAAAGSAKRKSAPKAKAGTKTKKGGAPAGARVTASMTPPPPPDDKF